MNAQDATQAARHYDLHAALQDMDALLPMDVYERLFDLVAAHRPEHILEIGTAHGGATIAMALGARSVGHDCRITTVDALTSAADRPSSRTRHGDAAANEAIVRRNFERAGVQDLIDLFVGTSEAAMQAGVVDSGIDMLVLDADGRVDRDLRLFRHLMRDDALVVIDDVDGRAKTTIMPDGTTWIDLKHIISQKLLAAFLDAGQLKEIDRIRNTSFCRAVRPQLWSENVLRERALGCYRELVFTTVDNEWAIRQACKDPSNREIVLNGRVTTRCAGGLLRSLRSMSKRLRGRIS